MNNNVMTKSWILLKIQIVTCIRNACLLLCKTSLLDFEVTENGSVRNRFLSYGRHVNSTTSVHFR